MPGKDQNLEIEKVVDVWSLLIKHTGSSFLVDGSNPFGKMSQNGSLPQISGWNFKNQSKPPPSVSVREMNGNKFWNHQTLASGIWIAFFDPSLSLSSPKTLPQ